MQLVYLHGFATTPDIWSRAWKPANKLRGFQDDGNSEETETCLPAGTAFSLRFPNLNFGNMDAESQKLANQLRPGSILIGWSMGGMLALKTTELAGDKIKALVLISTTPKFIRSPDFPHGLPMALLKRLEKKIRAEGTAAFHNLVFKNTPSIGLAHLSWEEVGKEFTELVRIDLRGSLKKIRIPTLIVHGDRDEICLPSAAEYMRENILNSDLVMLPGVGHAPMIENPELFNSHLSRFIEKYV